MKRILVFILLLCSLLLLVSCNNDPANPSGSTEPQTTVPQTTEPATTQIVEVHVPAEEIPFTYSITDGKIKLLRYTGSDANVVVPEKVGDLPVGEIGEMAFAYNTAIKSVDIPGSLTETGKFAFYHCDNLEKVILHEGTTAVSYACFSACTSLKDVSFPASVKTIGIAAFKGCTALTSINLEGLELIDDAAFCASGLTEVTVPTSVTTTGAEVFMECPNLTKANWVSTCTLREKTFAYCEKLVNVSLAEGVSRLYDDCFRRCLALKEITFPSTCIRFYSHCLYGCTALEKITFNETSFDRFYEMSFHFLPSLTDVYFAGSESQWNSINWGDHNEGCKLDAVTVHFGA